MDLRYFSDAEEINALNNEIEKLRNALKDITFHNINSEESAFRMQEIARKALSGRNG